MSKVCCFACCEVRKVKIADPVRKPGRRSGFRSGGFSRPMERSLPRSELVLHCCSTDNCVLLCIQLN